MTLNIKTSEKQDTWVWIVMYWYSGSQQGNQESSGIWCEVARVFDTEAKVKEYFSKMNPSSVPKYFVKKERLQ